MQACNCMILFSLVFPVGAVYKYDYRCWQKKNKNKTPSEGRQGGNYSLKSPSTNAYHVPLSSSSSYKVHHHPNVGLLAVFPKPSKLLLNKLHLLQTLRSDLFLDLRCPVLFYFRIKDWKGLMVHKMRQIWWTRQWVRGPRLGKGGFGSALSKHSLSRCMPESLAVEHRYEIGWDIFFSFFNGRYRSI